MPPNLTCLLCSKPIKSSSLVLFQHGDLFHVPCVSRAHELRLSEVGAVASHERARVAAAVKRTTDLTKKLRRLTIGRCANCRRSIWPGPGGTPRGGYLRRPDGQPIHLRCPKPR